MHATDTVINDPIDIVLAKQELVIRYPFRGTHIVVQTTVPQMTEHHHATTGKIMLKLPVGRFDEFGKKRRRYGNIMGYLVIVTIFTGVVACLGFLGWAMFF